MHTNPWVYIILNILSFNSQFCLHMPLRRFKVICTLYFNNRRNIAYILFIMTPRYYSVSLRSMSLSISLIQISDFNPDLRGMNIYWEFFGPNFSLMFSLQFSRVERAFRGLFLTFCFPVSVSMSRKSSA